jgi:hypothetical protein
MSACNPGELLEKYIEMRELRRLDGEKKLADPKPRMRALATRFPGALREIDELPLETIHSRIRALEAWKMKEDAPEPWMIAMARFHAAMREVLAIKRVIGRKKLTPAIKRAATRVAPTSAWDLARVARPPNGRLTDLVFQHVAEEMELTPKRVRELVFGR